jgi:hypothetical protein
MLKLFDHFGVTVEDPGRAVLCVTSLSIFSQPKPFQVFRRTVFL